MQQSQQVKFAVAPSLLRSIASDISRNPGYHKAPAVLHKYDGELIEHAAEQLEKLETTAAALAQAQASILELNEDLSKAQAQLEQAAADRVPADELTSTIDELTSTIDELTSTIDEQAQTIGALREQVAEDEQVIDTQARLIVEQRETPRSYHALVNDLAAQLADESSDAPELTIVIVAVPANAGVGIDPAAALGIALEALVG